VKAVASSAVTVRTMTPVASSTPRCSSSRIIDHAAQVLATVSEWNSCSRAGPAASSSLANSSLISRWTRAMFLARLVRS